MWAAMPLLFALACPLQASAGQTVSVRLVEAHGEGQGLSPALNDVAGMLRKNLPYPRFDLLDSRNLKLPSDGTLQMRGGITMQYGGSAGAFRVAMRRGKTPLLSTTIALTKGRPFILGGFKGSRGRVLVLLVLK
jgi:hypothetical protein